MPFYYLNWWLLLSWWFFILQDVLCSQYSQCEALIRIRKLVYSHHLFPVHIYYRKCLSCKKCTFSLVVWEAGWAWGQSHPTAQCYQEQVISTASTDSRGCTSWATNETFPRALPPAYPSVMFCLFKSYHSRYCAASRPSRAQDVRKQHSCSHPFSLAGGFRYLELNSFCSKNNSVYPH